MNDETGAGASGASGSVESGGVGSVQSFKDRASDAVLSHGDMEDYVAERKERAAEKQGDDGIELPYRKQARAERFQRALEAASKAGEPGPQQSADSQNASHEASEESWDYEAAQRHRDDSVRAQAQYEMRASEFARNQPDYHETIQAILPVFPPHEEVAAELMRSPHGPAITYALASNIDALEELNAMSPQQAKRWIAKWEGQLEERAAYQQHAQPPRKASKAPPPMKAPPGGASPPSSNDPAKMSMDEYAKWRRRQESARL